MFDESIYARTSCARGLEFNSRSGHILHSVENGSPPIQHSCVA